MNGPQRQRWHSASGEGGLARGGQALRDRSEFLGEEDGSIFPGSKCRVAGREQTTLPAEMTVLAPTWALGRVVMLSNGVLPETPPARD